MAKVFSRKKFSSYLGEERALLDIITSYESNPTPTPTPTPSMTPTLTNTPTPSNTPTLTPTSSSIATTPTSTPTLTPTPTLTSTPTLTPTPSSLPFDMDAQTYIDNVIGSGGTIDATASAATNTLFTELKSNGLYSKLKVMYPILGNTLGGFAINAVSPGYKNVIWYNNPTASPLGVQYDGVSQYGDTGWAALTDTTIYSAGTIGYFCNIINTSAYGGEMMAVGGGGNNRWGAFGGEGEWYSDWGLGGLYARVATWDYSGGTIICRSSLPDLQDVWFNGTLLGSGSGASRAGAAFFANTIQLGRREDGYYSNGRYGFYFIADFMDDGEVVLMNNIINNFQTTLGRNI